jgi:hypothetical protein
LGLCGPTHVVNGKLPGIIGFRHGRAGRNLRKLDQCLFLFFDLGLAALARRFVGMLPELVGVDL